MRKYIKKDHPIFKICKGYEKYVVSKAFDSYYRSANLELKHLLSHQNPNWSRVFYLNETFIEEGVKGNYNLISGIKSKRNGDSIEGFYTDRKSVV